ncbi:hypothetical protein SAMN04488109_6065 [Chryseolinea serpens]|uniref:Uncharacterized protein n=1 Tax=Chryseolinea serpens TaxID=947013 RepID=A0A1M5WVF2_9BACT|nr:hypothetical protein [Chryseolinea serpens]SHH91585.1 hypothetical protein SAMN04488109_6065 [Chryseolinea serpens]
MKYIDVTIQTLLFVFAIALLILSFDDGEQWYFVVLYAQVLLGPWQLLGSLTSILLKTRHYRLKIVHQLLSWIVLLVLYIIGRSTGEMPHPALLILVPWTLAFYYYLITWSEVIGKRVQGKFLPHLSF